MKTLLLSRLFDEAPSATERMLNGEPTRVGRRRFVKLGLAGLGVLASASAALAQYGQPYAPQPLPPPMPLPPGIPPAALTFEVASGVHPHAMLRLVREYLCLTLSPAYANQIVEARVVQRSPRTFHEQFWSNFALVGQIAPTRSRYGYWVSVCDLARADGRLGIRLHKDWNYFEMRRAITASEVQQFGVVVYPCGHRTLPCPADFPNFVRVCRTLYGLENPNHFELLYTRPFSDGRRSFTGYFVARRPDPLHTPFKDLLLDNVPV